MRFVLMMLVLFFAAAAQAQPYAALGASVDGGEAYPQASLGIGFGALSAEASTFRADQVSGYGLALVGKTPGKLSLVGSIGAYWLKDDGRTQGGAVPTSTRREHESRGAVGIGLSYALTKAVSLRAMLERIEDYGGRGNAALVVRFE